MSDLFDFGFTAVDEDELSTVQEATSAVEATQQQAHNVQERLDSLFNAILPLLNNLKKNPDKEYILWPNRLRKVEEFESQLFKIYKGESGES